MEKKNNRETYETPTVELLKFDNNDVITTSGFDGEEDIFDRGNGRGVRDDSDAYNTPDVKID